MRWLLVSAAVLALAVPCAALEVAYSAPLVRTVPLATVGAGAAVLHARVVVPDGAPEDLGVAAWRDDGLGGWTTSEPVRLAAGGNDLHLSLAAAGPGAAGLQFWSASQGRWVLTISDVAVAAASAPPAPTLADVRWDGMPATPAPARVDEPWSFACAPSRLDGFALRAEIVAPDGARWIARGRRDGRGWSVRLHPRVPGEHRVTVIASWSDAASPTLTMPLTIVASGAAAGGRELALAAPLETRLTQAVADAAAAQLVVIDVIVPDDAPEDLALGAYARIPEVGWRQAPLAQRVATGRHRLRLRVPPARTPARAGEAGVLAWSASPTPARLRVIGMTIEAAPTLGPRRPRLGDARLVARPIAPADPWTLDVAPWPPADAAFAIDAELAHGAAAPLRLAGVPLGDGAWRLCGHPYERGGYAVRLAARWGGGASATADLRALTIDGPSPFANEPPPTAVRAPLATLVAQPHWPATGAPAGREIAATIVVADGAPADLGVGAYARDQDGRWWQCRHPAPLVPGINRLRLRFARGAVEPSGHGAGWSAAEAATAGDGGLFFWSSRPTSVRAESTVAAVVAPPAAATRLDLIGVRAGSVPTGQRWEVALSPAPFPDNPYDADEFALDAVVREPDGTERRIAGFHIQDMTAVDRGDREVLTPRGPGRFVVRYRPRVPGAHSVRLRARWRGGAQVDHAVPLSATGAAWDDYVQVDKADPRFFSVAGKFWWPKGPNLRSTYDLRSREFLQTTVTPDRGTAAYDAYFARLSAHGVDACEIWMSSWNLALEWRRGWTGFHGVGRYSEMNAWRLDRVLDAAWRRGIRVNLVINNHGQASKESDPEWDHSPYNQANGGFLADPSQVFTDPRAMAMQDRLRRYLIARYADHPAIIGWKLWTEMDLTAGARVGALPAWHEQALARWQELDPYGHPASSHWCGDYGHVDPAIASQANYDYVCIDAYHGVEANLAQLLYASAHDPDRGLSRYRKPILVTEFGGNWCACPEPLMRVDHASGAWAAWVSGHAGSPMLWWFEWLDQRGGFAPFRAIAEYGAGEDLRGADARSIALSVGPANAANQRWWGAAWARPGRILGYIQDRQWAAQGGDGTQARSSVRVPGSWQTGRWQVEWWDADAGRPLSRTAITHTSGMLALVTPSLKRHIAFKLWRE
ncbi:MAG TPA: hypothetical protein VEL07_20970 [Planctomycetota bacterium]|nr:hypothetical protein [Planctomycetota bacterium]